MRREIFLIAILLLSLFPSKAKAQYYEKIEINAPDEMKYQPVDVRIKFNKPCYALNEEENSIKVFYNGREIESQIHSLERSSGGFIKACNVVFLYQGKGTYVIQYGEKAEEKQYVDHVEVRDAYYYTEPISGYFAKINYYEIREDGKPLFGICQQGSILGIEMANKMIKVKGNSFEMKNWEQLFSFAFFYAEGKTIGTDEKLVGKKIIVDGNLMARVAIESASSNNKVKTKAIYTYYYSPSDEKRMFIQLRHEALEKCRVYGKTEENGMYAYILCARARSSSIEELNMGEILPNIYLNGKDGIERYEMETDPQNRDYKWLLSSSDNILLGEKPWVCMDGNSKAYGFILSKDEYKVKAVVRQEVNVPGLEIDGGGVSVGRVEEGDIPEGIIYKGIIEFFYGKGYEDVKKEAEAFFFFNKYRQFSEEEVEKVKKTMHNLTIITHFRHSFPFSSYISALFGVSVPHLEAEIWSNDTLIAKSVVNFYKASFQLPEREYIAKIYLIGKEKKYIGYKKISLHNDLREHVFCTFGGKVNIETKEKTMIKIFDENGIEVEKMFSKGETIFSLPALKTYRLEIIYKGFLLHEDSFFLLFRYNKEYDIPTYSLFVNIKDTLGLPVGIALNPILKSSEMKEKVNIESKKKGSLYIFDDLPEAKYELVVKYKNLSIRKDISVPEQKEIEIIFPITYFIKVKTYDERGFPIKAKVLYEREGKEYKESKLPPANYVIKIYDGNKLIASKKIFLISNADYKIVTTKFSPYPYFIAVIIFAIFIIKRKLSFSTFIAILLSSSFIFSWWHLSSFTKLYIFPPKIIEFFEEGYGTFSEAPSLFYSALYVVLLLLTITFLFLFTKKLFPLSIVPLSFSIIFFIFVMMKFAEATTRSIIGGNENATWGLGIGFYSAFASLILIIAKVALNEIRRGG